MLQTAFEIVNFTTADQAAAVVAPVGAITINSSVAQNSLTTAAATTAVNTTNATGAAILVDSATAISTTFTHTGVGTVSVTLTADTATADTVTVTGAAGAATVVNAVGSGLATVNLSTTGTAIDNISFQSGGGIVASTDLVTVNGFSVTNDLINLDSAIDTTPIVGQKVFSSAAAATLGTGTTGGANSLSTFAFDMGGTVNVLGGVLDGSGLIQNNGALTVTAADTGYIVAYDNGNAYLYRYVSADTALIASEIALIGVFNGVAVGALGNANFTVA
jgi:hypothetical protein